MYSTCFLTQTREIDKENTIVSKLHMKKLAQRLKISCLYPTVESGFKSMSSNFWAFFCFQCASVLSRCSRVQLFATPWTVVGQAPLSMGFSR